MIVLVRIDDRLIHGQIVEGWVKPVRADHIVVVSDEVARDRMQQVLLRMAAPSSIKVSNFAVDEAIGKLLGGDLEKERLLLLLSGPQDALRLIKGGVRILSVNVGGMHYTPGKQQILRTLSVDESDIAALREISSLGVELEGRVLPCDDRINVMDVISRVMLEE